MSRPDAVSLKPGHTPAAAASVAMTKICSVFMHHHPRPGDFCSLLLVPRAAYFAPAYPALNSAASKGVAPAFIDSEGVIGCEQWGVRVVLHGLTGPLSAKCRSNRLDMLALGVFNDEQISNILTYIRREWENTGAPIEPETVKFIRTATADRHEAWWNEHLREIP